MSKIAEKFRNAINGDMVSDLQVMQSAAGFYIGRSYWDTEGGFEGPYCRESGYFKHRDIAEDALTVYRKLYTEDA